MSTSDIHEPTNWYVIYTKPSQEDLVAKYLQTASFDVLNPAIRKKRFYKGRLKMVVEKLFPCYVFARFDPERDYRLIKYTRGVRYVIGSRSGTPYMVDKTIIDSIHARMKDGFIDLSAKELKPGDRLIITDGPMTGFEGVFLCERPRDRVLILLREVSCRLEIEKQSVSLASK